MPDDSHALPNGPSDDELRAYVRDLRAIDAELDILKVKRKGIRKVARGSGVKLLLMDRRLERSGWSPDEIVEERRDEDRYAQLLGQPIGVQAEMFGDARTPQAQREIIHWAAVGRMHGMSGKGLPGSPPDVCPPEAAQAYASGWTEGDDETRKAHRRVNPADARTRVVQGGKGAKADGDAPPPAAA